MIVQMTGRSGAGKSTLAHAVARRLQQDGRRVEVLDGDVLRQGLCADLGFSEADRVENLRRLAHVANILHKHDIIVILAVINPLQTSRQTVKALCPESRLVYVRCDIEVLRTRDTKRLYANNAPGIYLFEDASEFADFVVDTGRDDKEASCNRLYEFFCRELRLGLPTCGFP